MNGLLIIDKPGGMTSHDVVNIVRRATGEKSIGHLGTLDPLATGVLPLLLGKYTRLAQFFGQAEKHYTGTIRFGFATDTFDSEGAPLENTARLPVTLDLAELREHARVFAGDMDQIPPVFSAKKLGGIPAHRLARQGKEVPVKPARIHIYRFALTSLADDVAGFEMHVSAGGYVRSVAHELGQLTGTGAHLASLRRTQAGPFTLQAALTIAELKMLSPQQIAARLPHPRTLLPHMPSVTVDEQTAGRIRNGIQVNVPEFSEAALVKIFRDPSDLIAIGRRVAGTLMQPVIVMA